MKQIPRNNCPEERKSFEKYIEIEENLVRAGLLAEDMKHSVKILECSVTPRWVKNVYKSIIVACVVPLALSLGLVGNSTYDLVKSYFPKQEYKRSIGNTLDVRVHQEGKGKNTTKFIDYKPFKSLDEVVRIQDGKVVTLSPSDDDFQEQEKVYNDKIVPYFNR